MLNAEEVLDPIVRGAVIDLFSPSVGEGFVFSSGTVIVPLTAAGFLPKGLRKGGMMSYARIYQCYSNDLLDSNQFGVVECGLVGGK